MKTIKSTKSTIISQRSTNNDEVKDQENFNQKWWKIRPAPWAGAHSDWPTASKAIEVQQPRSPIRPRAD